MTNLMRFMRILADATAPMTAKEIGSAVHGEAFNARTRSASAANNAYQLIRLGWATRALKRRELYVYSITDAGRVALSSATEKPAQ